MIATPTHRRALAIAATLAAFGFAASIVVDTLRAVVPLRSPLPWFDEWATAGLIRAWQDGRMTGAEVLFAQHNEHRILVPRLVFFADDLLTRGAGTLTLAAIFAVQALHAGLFALVLGRARPARAGRWAVAAVALALMFSLRQAENFSSGFQLQFVAVFAGATLSFALFGSAAARERQGRPSAGPLLGSLAAALLTALTMANGLAAAFLLAVLAVLARLRPRTVVLCAGFALVLTAVYLHGYEPVAHHSSPAESLRHPLRLASYVAVYLGDVAAGVHEGPAAAFGLAGLAAAAAAAVRTARRREAAPGPLAMLGVMLFAVASAAVTASGRLDLGLLQALSSRYATGSAAFWAAQLTYWWIDPPRWHFRAVPAGSLGRAAVAAAAIPLVVAALREQDRDKPQLARQSFARNHAADALMLGLVDPAAMAQVSWSAADASALAGVLREDRLSVFGTADAASVGRPVAERGTPAAPCAGAVSSAVADPALGRDGVRVSGRAAEGTRRVRRVLLADAAGRVAGFASGAVPGAAPDAWEGYAVAPVGAALTAYGLLDGGRLCRIGAAAVAPPAQASQPEEAP